MSVFAKAKSNVKPVKAAPKKATIWVAPPAVAEAVKQLVALDREKDAIETKMAVPKRVVTAYAKDQYFGDYARTEVPPETPMQVQSNDGDKITFVVQDRSAQYAVKEDQLEMLSQLLGGDAAANLVAEETSFAFSREVLAREGVLDALDKALSGVTKKLREAKILGEEEDLLEATTKTAFKPGTLQRLALICGSDKVKMEQVVQAMGSAATMYTKC